MRFGVREVSGFRGSVQGPCGCATVPENNRYHSAMRWVTAGLLGMTIGCGGSSEPAESPATVVHVEAMEEPSPAEETMEEAEESAPLKTIPVEGLAEHHCEGMKREGPIWVDLTARDPYELRISLTPGSCLTVVAAATDGAPLELSLVADMPGIPMQMPVLAQGRSEGPGAVLGGTPSCFNNPMPMPMQARVLVNSSSATSAGVLVCRR